MTEEMATVETFRPFHVEIKGMSLLGTEKLPFGSNGLIFAPTLIINGVLIKFDHGEPQPDPEDGDGSTYSYPDAGYAEILINPFMTIRLVNVTDECFTELNTSMEENWMDPDDTRGSFSLPVSSLKIYESQQFGRDVESFS